MKLVTFDGGRVGMLDDATVVELDVPSMRTYFEAGQPRRETGRRFALGDIKLEAPIIPKKFFHTSGNFVEHEEESKRVNWSHPIHKGLVFFQNVDAIIGPGEPVIYPEHLTRQLDYELEMAMVIGKPGKFFTPEEASEHIAGYVIFNDITARDIQRREMRSGVFSFCKAIDTFCPVGPYIVTADEVGDPHALAMELRVNGAVRQKGNTSRMRLTIPQLIAYHSPQGYSAGDLVSTGTISGVAGFRPDAEELYLRPGDVVEAEIEKLGILRNPIISWEQGHGSPAPSGEFWQLEDDDR
jgi:2-keto-4-pentenoate hydratase/2-oxohepta-3-ene-1,7-dioic acid hydratase in catechol pathway